MILTGFVTTLLIGQPGSTITTWFYFIYLIYILYIHYIKLENQTLRESHIMERHSSDKQTPGYHLCGGTTGKQQELRREKEELQRGASTWYSHVLARGTAMC